MAAGLFTYEVRAAGADPESEPAIQVKGNLAAGQAYSVAAVGRRDRLQGVLLRDDLAPSAPGLGRVRFLDAAFELPAVDIALEAGRVLEAGVGSRSRPATCRSPPATGGSRCGGRAPPWSPWWRPAPPAVAAPGPDR